MFLKLDIITLEERVEIMATHTVNTAAEKSAQLHHQAFFVLRTIFTVAPIVFGLDKFTNLLTDWTHYLAPLATDIIPVSPQVFMYAVGVVEIIAGILVALRPKIGSLVVCLWLLGIIVNLIILPGFFDVALRDFGLLVAAFALNRLALARDV